MLPAQTKQQGGLLFRPLCRLVHKAVSFTSGTEQVTGEMYGSHSSFVQGQEILLRGMLRC